MWFVFALGSAVFAALTSILAKIGIDGVNSTLATAIRTAVVLLMRCWPKLKNIFWHSFPLLIPFPTAKMDWSGTLKHSARN